MSDRLQGRTNGPASASARNEEDERRSWERWERRLAQTRAAPPDHPIFTQPALVVTKFWFPGGRPRGRDPCWSPDRVP